MDKLDVIQLVAAAVVITIVAVWMKLQWEECREAGLSILYCIQHIG
jgi:hypothetical protein